MATIIAYTTIDQSRKLAEILPLESADMRYEYPSIEKDEIQEPMNGFHTLSFNLFKEIDSFIYFPCWSLAALLGVLPKGTRLLKSTNISSIGDVKYHCECPKANIDKWFDNAVDACVAMIEKLHELKML